MTDTQQLRMSGLVMGSQDPDKASEWYLTAFGAAAERGTLLGRPVVTIGGARLVFDRRTDIGARAVEPQRMLINVFVTDIQAMAATLEPMGCRWVRPIESVPDFGSIATVEDFDGNYLQLLQGP